LAPAYGKHQAQALLQEALHADGAGAGEVLAALAGGAVAPEIQPAAEAMVDEVVRRGRAARAAESETWPA
jgi:ethanolamine utilization microcompartment shell protein EutL